jgi:hypothetical protein
MRSLALFFALATAACSSAQPEPRAPALPGPAPVPAGTEVQKPDTASKDPFAVEGLVREEWLPLLGGPRNAASLAPPGVDFADAALPPPPKGVPNAPKSCAAWERRAANKPAAACATAAEALALLDAALGESGVDARDASLASLESCAGFEPGLVRSLRIELAPIECGDALAAPSLAPKAGVTGSLQHVLVGQAIAARLHRAVANPPRIEAPFTRERVQAFVTGPVATWMKEQSIAVEELAKTGAKLSYYGRALVALASGTADLRLVDAVRGVPIPDEFRKDPELANAYYAALDENLEPRKQRGRDGALVGLRELAHAGAIDDPRATAARALLVKLYGGRRVDALDALLLPPLATPSEASLEARLAARLPTFHAGLLLAPELAAKPEVLRAFARRGVPVAHRAFLKDAALGDEARSLYARARLELGRRYWRAVDFDVAARLYAAIAREKLSHDDRMLFALSLALRGGPDDVAALMVKNDAFGPEFGRIAALDVVADDEKAGAARGLAAFDAAVLRQLAAPRGGEPTVWSELGERYRKASALLVEVPARNEAEERARAADATAAALAKSR